MNKIEYGLKLDFSNVLIRPKRSTLNSRSEVDLNRTFKFKYSSYDWYGVLLYLQTWILLAHFVFTKH